MRETEVKELQQEHSSFLKREKAKADYEKEFNYKRRKFFEKIKSENEDMAAKNQRARSLLQRNHDSLVQMHYQQGENKLKHDLDAMQEKLNKERNEFFQS